MFTIHVSSKAVNDARSKAPVQEIRPSEQVSGQAPYRASDRDLPQAWSIGVTNSAREWTGKSAPEKTEETCPPEVYIG